jgi:hypothetical protein
MVTEQQLKDRLGERLTSGDMTKDQVLTVINAWKSDNAKSNTRQQEQETARQGALKETAQGVGAFESYMIATGKGFTDIGRAIGLAGPETESDKQAMEALRVERPYTTAAGEITGQAAPFIPAGLGAAALAAKFVPGMLGQVVAGTAVGAGEGAAISSGTGGSVLEGASVGAAVGGGAEVLFPVLGRLGRALYRRVKGAEPTSSMFDSAGRPTPEMQSALDDTGLTMEDLTVEAEAVIRNAEPGSDPAQIARAAQFTNEQIPMSRGSLTKSMADEATEQQLMKSTMDPNAEPFRQFKLKQSQAIQEKLNSTINTGQNMEETGNLIKEALTGQKALLRTQKNDLYREALQAADSADALPIMANMEGVIPDARTIRGLDRASEGKATAIIETLADYGLANPTARQLADENFAPTMLTLQDAEEVQQILKGIARNDLSGATQSMVGRATQAIDEELANIAENTSGLNLTDSVIKPLKAARATVTRLKNEFDPKSLSGQLVDNIRGSNQPRVEGSKIYNKLVSKAAPVEGVRSMVTNLRNAGPEGEQALFGLQSTTMLDLIDAGFGTASRQIDGIRTFNPNAFRKRLDNIGAGKIDAIFSTSPSTLQRMKNIDKIAENLIPSNDAVPKGAAPVLQDIARRLGLATISAKAPGAGLVIDKLSEISSKYATRQEVKQAMNTDPDLAAVVYRIDREFPGIAAALGIAGILTMDERAEDDTN